MEDEFLVEILFHENGLKAALADDDDALGS